jgi:hypothetical protein
VKKTPSAHATSDCYATILARLAPGALALAAVACSEPYRVGEHVWVEWEEGRNYPAYIVERKTRMRYRVHYDGYDARWDEEVTLDRIHGRVQGPVVSPAPPDKVTRALGAGPRASSNAPVSPYKVGDRIRVRWRESIYAASVLEVVAPDKVKVHYEGHEPEWDETVSLDRIVPGP